jgi:hypothetical protein
VALLNLEQILVIGFSRYLRTRLEMGLP